MSQQTNSRKLLTGQFIKAVCCSNILLFGSLLLLEPIVMARGNERLKHDYLVNKIVLHRKDLTLDSQILKQGSQILSTKSTEYPQKSFFTYPLSNLQSSKLFAQVITTSSQVTQAENTTEPEPRVIVTEVIVRSEKGKLEDRLINEVYRVISTKPGQTTTRSRLQEDINAIFGTGFFSNVQALPEDTPLGVRVSFVVQPNPILIKVEIQANPGTDVSSVLSPNTTDEVFSKQYGRILNLRSLQEGIKQLTKRYQDQGYVLANVIGSPKVSETGVVTLQIAEGVMEEIQVRFLNKNESATDEKGNPIKGVTPVKEILSTVKSKPGQIFRRSQIQKDLQLLYQLGITEDMTISLEPSKQDPYKVVVVINIINELISEWNVWTRKAKAALDAAEVNDEHETAVKQYRELLEIFHSNKLQEKEALTLNNLANLYRKSQKYQLAFDTYRDALPIFHDKAPFLEVVTLINMAQISYQLKKPEQAIRIYEQALSRIRVIKNNPSPTNLFGSLVGEFKDDFKLLGSGYLTIAEIGLTLDIGSSYATKGDYQQAIYASHNFNSNNSRNIVDVWANIVNSNLESFSLDESEQRELLKFVPQLAQALSQTPDIYSSSILRFTYSDLGYESKAKIYEKQSKTVIQEVLATLQASVNKKASNSYNPYIRIITNTIIFFLKDNKTQQEEQKITQDPEVLNVKKTVIKIAQNMVNFGLVIKTNRLVMIINSFPQIVKDILKPLPKNDYPVLNSRLYVECWLAYALDNSLTSMRDLFKRLNNTGIDVSISTFSKANTHRSQEIFQNIYHQLNQLVQKKAQKKLKEKYAICPIDSTVITLTSKLLWVLGYHQVKLFSSLNLSTGSPEDNLINFGYAHDYKFGSPMMSNLPLNAVGVMDRGFAGLDFMQELVQKDKYFIVRVKNNWKLEFESETGLVKIGSSTDAPAYRVINFCDKTTKTEFRLVTNLPADGEAAVTDDEIRDMYRLRWGVELLWKFLKMHLKLDRLITKNVNGIAIQIYSSLIAYLILQLVSVPKEWGEKMLDKFRYLQACMCQQISYVHWMEDIMRC